MTEETIEGVLFDLDGTLLDTYEVILTSMQYATRTVLDVEIPPATLMAKVGQPLAVQMADFTDDRETQETLLRVYREHNALIHDDLVKPFTGTEDVLRALQAAGLPIGVVTSKRHEPAFHGLSLFGLDAYLSCLIGADDWDTFKPDPGPVAHGVELLGVAPSRCLYVGDSPFDLQAGRGAGCVTVAALWGMFPEAVLAAESPDASCRSIRDVLEVAIAGNTLA